MCLSNATVAKQQSRMTMRKQMKKGRPEDSLVGDASGAQNAQSKPVSGQSALSKNSLVFSTLNLDIGN